MKLLRKYGNSKIWEGKWYSILLLILIRSQLQFDLMTVCGVFVMKDVIVLRSYAKELRGFDVRWLLIRT